MENANENYRNLARHNALNFAAQIDSLSREIKNRGLLELWTLDPGLTAHLRHDATDP